MILQYGISDAVALFGFLMLYRAVTKIQSLFVDHFTKGVIFKSTEYLESYKGTDTWAVVTGGSDGIGFQYCDYLAKHHGYNICIISRNEDKMHKCCEMLRANHPSIKSKYIVADFSLLSTI